MDNIYDVIILGSGPAGLTAAIYTTRADLKTLVVAGGRWGGQLQLTTLVENFPGFPDGIQGPELMQNMRKQAERFGTQFIDENFVSGDFSNKPFKIKVSDKDYLGKSVIIATGADTKWLDVPGEAEKIGRGVSSCAPCDAAFFRDKDVVVVGGGDSAMEEALVLTKFAKSVKIIHRGDSFRASEIMQKKVFENEKISVVFNTKVEEVLGDQKVTGIKLNTICSDGSIIVKPMDKLSTHTPEQLGGKTVKMEKSQTSWELPVEGIFVAIGHIPNTSVFKDIELDEKGFVKVYEHYLTNKEGVFVAGDVHDAHYKQAITAAGFGCAAALEAERWLDDIGL